MSAYRDLLADIVPKLKAVPGTGIVHDYERQAADLGKFIALFKDPASGQIRGWEITRRAVPEHRRGATFRHHQFRLNGYLGLRDADATSIELQELADAVCAAFRTAGPGPTWVYGNGDDPEASPCQVERIDDRMFGGVLCHCAEIALSVTERIV
jgi:hypothetical protein